jgi:hypothetical protein
MGFPVPQKAAQFSVDGQVYALGAFDWDTPIGRAYNIGIFIRMADGSWNSYSANSTNGAVVQYMNAGDCLKDMQAKGGRVKYLQWLLAKINEVLEKLFAGAAPVTQGEPTTDQQARDIISAWALGLRVNNTTPPTAQ